MEKLSLRLLACTVALGMAVPVAQSATVSSNLTVTATVPATCTITTVTNMAFPNYDGSANVDGSGSVNINCPNNLAYSVFSASTRSMALGANILNFGLFTDTARQNSFPTAAGVNTYTGTGANQALTIHGRIPAGQNVPAGNYSATIAITVSF